MFSFIVSLIIFLSIILILLVITQKPTLLSNPGMSSSGSSQRFVKSSMDPIGHAIWIIMTLIFALAIISSIMLSKSSKFKSVNIERVEDQLEVIEDTNNNEK